MALRNLFTVSVLLVLGLVSCTRNPNDPGTEFAPQMYHTIPYDPYSQVVDTSSEFYNTIKYNNPGFDKTVIRSNMRKPAKGSLARKFYSGTPRNQVAKSLYVHDIPADSLDRASRELKNPLENTEANLAEGKVLFERYCAPCHGKEGKGDGKVGAVYKGVPNYSAGRYATLTEGHIFWVITHGKGWMWPHGSQVNPDDRWRIVQYVQTLQKAQ